MKKIKCLVSILAALAFALPAAACNTGTRTNEGSVPEESTPLFPEEEPPVTVPEENPPAVAPETPEETAPKTPEEPERAEYLMITASSLNVRTGAGTSYAVLGTVEKGILMKYAGLSNGWYETAYCGKKAFVSASYAKIVSLEKADGKTEAVIEEGLKCLGTPYVYGAIRLHDGKGTLYNGFTETKFDCSSLMQYIFYRGADVLLNTTTRTQITQGAAVEKDDLQRGDLMFFTNASRKDNVGIERVGHVALYLGENYILHTASDYAKIEQISTLRWSYFIQAKRVL